MPCDSQRKVSPGKAVIAMILNGPSSIPLWMDPLDGNSSDKVSFHETIKKVEDFRAQYRYNREI